MIHDFGQGTLKADVHYIYSVTCELFFHRIQLSDEVCELEIHFGFLQLLVDVFFRPWTGLQQLRRGNFLYSKSFRKS